MTREQVLEVASVIGAINYIECSAKTMDSVKALTWKLAYYGKIYGNNKRQEQKWGLLSPLLRRVGYIPTILYEDSLRGGEDVTS